MTMKLFAALAFAFLLSVPAIADEKLSEREMENLNIALGLLGCEGGTAEKETQGKTSYEVDDAKCKNGRFDIEFDDKFEVIEMERD